jgi:uncharacterized protein YdaU (DUF1376 family)
VVNAVAEFPALPLWTDALIGDTYHLTPAEFGSYLRLLIVEWRTKDCSLPNDDVFLGRAIGDPKNWHRLKAVVMAFFTLGEDGRYRQKRLLDERNFVSGRVSRASAGGHAKALKRKNRGSAKVLLNERSNLPPTPTPTVEEGTTDTGFLSLSSGTSEPSPIARTEVRAKARERATVIGEYKPGDKARENAIKYWQTKKREDLVIAIDEQVAQFIAHHKHKGTRGLDWDSGWQTWYANAVRFTKPPTTNGHTGGHVNGFGSRPLAEYEAEEWGHICERWFGLGKWGVKEHWPLDAGPKPGEKGCRCPLELLKKYTDRAKQEGGLQLGH